ncbi:GTP cyclohydrolase I [Ruicaihuangia caeni]|uniref:GTP cyclohydrolase 1 n=1 Tax=Ruicaihuangia caeni TaxID=3042517 RepID=A0AAW6T8T6_9MICO|nr:GTP cyclohydrolase I [Klugiella sp. YN-L-19]MDI2098453.1 GTP cyclohydrolase I [Klugiella sp. YN-L-19]
MSEQHAMQRESHGAPASVPTDRPVDAATLGTATGVDVARVEAAVREIVAALGGGPTLERTPERVAQAYSEFFAGIGVDPLTHLTDTVAVGPETGELVLQRDIEFRSMCEHHLLPFIGVVHVAYVPGERVVGLGKLARVVETIASRPQLQERLTEEIADALETGLDPRGVLVVVDAQHSCVSARGTRQAASTTVTMASRGELATAAHRAEVMALIGGIA